MSNALYLQLLDLLTGSVLTCAMLVLWRRGLVAIIRLLAVQGAALVGVALLLGLHSRDPEPLVVAVLIATVKVWLIPRALLEVIGAAGVTRESEPLVNIPSSLLAGAALTLVAYVTTAPVTRLAPSPEIRAVPIGVAVVLIGFFVLVTRRTAVSQIVGFLLLDNGIALVAFLATAGVPLVVELGASLDLLLAVLVLQVLAARMRTKFGDLDLDQLRGLHD